MTVSCIQEVIWLSACICNVLITVRGNVYIRVGVVGYGTIAKESNTQRYTKGLTAVPYIRRLTVSTYISETATVVTYKKEDATVSTLF